MHTRSRHLGGLGFPLLIAAVPALAPFVFTNEWGTQTLDFADPAAIKLLNTALLKHHYGVAHWDIPEGYLCPSVPGRADYIHSLADLLAGGRSIPRGKSVRALDIGTGANCVYPLIGNAEYGWSFVGSEIDAKALANAKSIVAENGLRGAIELRLQRSPQKILSGLLAEGEQFDVSLCNPPFHASAKEAAEASQRKWKNLGKGGSALNFGGQSRELWTAGGESAFVRKMVEESVAIGKRVRWFTSLISKSANLPAVERALQRARAARTKTIEMKQGQKTSRLVAWSFQ
jgi:23S rRNA (adenine1618-N6)-methyltransferase